MTRLCAKLGSLPADLTPPNGGTSNHNCIGKKMLKCQVANAVRFGTLGIDQKDLFYL